MKSARRQRRPAFDREEGVELARALFHTKGFDAVSIADLTEALNINPPSLYAAYGSKLALFGRVLRSYTETDYLPMDQILAPEREPVEALTDLFVSAARHYTRDAHRLGCMVTEAMRADDPAAAGLASSMAEEGTAMIRKFIKDRAAPDRVDRIVDYVLLNLRGLSSYSCLGYSQAKLVECSKIAGRALVSEFAADDGATAH